ncbi:uncharacterized protein LOC134230864 [Saccostrea cucullata]|uniref:uncharacterized protein LOC134230864 n=1 Tax=Saccostrea cuccullata TaxID=36930 RepID=UPI002ED24972
MDASEDDGSMARLINDENINPNVNIKVIHEEFADPHLCIFAVNDIKDGEEIRYTMERMLIFLGEKRKYMMIDNTQGEQSVLNEEKLRCISKCNSVNPELSTERTSVVSQTTNEQLCEDSSNGNVFDTLI